MEHEVGIEGYGRLVRVIRRARKEGQRDSDRGIMAIRRAFPGQGLMGAKALWDYLKLHKRATATDVAGWWCRECWCDVAACEFGHDPIPGIADSEATKAMSQAAGGGEGTAAKGAAHAGPAPAEPERRAPKIFPKAQVSYANTVVRYEDGSIAGRFDKFGNFTIDEDVDPRGEKQ